MLRAVLVSPEQAEPCCAVVAFATSPYVAHPASGCLHQETRRPSETSASNVHVYIKVKHRSNVYIMMKHRSNVYIKMKHRSNIYITMKHRSNVYIKIHNKTYPLNTNVYIEHTGICMFPVMQNRKYIDNTLIEYDGKG